MDKREVKSIIEALLFIWGDPLSIKDLSSILEIKDKELRNIIEEMVDEFNYERRGVKIIEVNDTFQLSTRPEHYEWIKKLCSTKSTKNLSNAAIETLCIIAYKQPITKSEIELIRGVRCDKSIENLMNRKLIKELGRLDKTGRPIIYGTTHEFLKYFGLKSLNNLPNLDEFKEKEKKEK